MTIDLNYISASEIDGNQVFVVASCPVLSPGQQVTLDGELHRVIRLERVTQPGPNEKAGQYRVIAKPLRAFHRKVAQASKPSFWQKLWG